MTQRRLFCYQSDVQALRREECNSAYLFRALFTQVMTTVTTRMVAQIVLVILLSGVPVGGGLNRRRERSLPFPRRFYARLHSLCGYLLLRSLRKNRRAVLRTNVVALAVERSWVVQL